MDTLKKLIKSKVEYYENEQKYLNKDFEEKNFEDFLIANAHSGFINDRFLRFFTNLNETIEYETDLGEVKNYLNNLKETAHRLLMNISFRTTTHPIKNIVNIWELEYLQTKIKYIDILLSKI